MASWALRTRAADVERVVAETCARLGWRETVRQAWAGLTLEGRVRLARCRGASGRGRRQGDLQRWARSLTRCVETDWRRDESIGGGRSIASTTVEDGQSRVRRRIRFDILLVRFCWRCFLCPCVAHRALCSSDYHALTWGAVCFDERRLRRMLRDDSFADFRRIVRSAIDAAGRGNPGPKSAFRALSRRGQELASAAVAALLKVSNQIESKGGQRDGGESDVEELERQREGEKEEEEEALGRLILDRGGNDDDKGAARGEERPEERKARKRRRRREREERREREDRSSEEDLGAVANLAARMAAIKRARTE